MDFFNIIIVFFLLLVFIGIPIMFYFLGKALQSKKTGVILAIVTFLLLISPIGYLMNEDLFFTKNDAQEILAKNDITLNDDFKFVHLSKSYLVYGEIEFILEISEKDHRRIWNQFQRKKDSIDLLLEKYPKTFKSYGVDENGDLYFDKSYQESCVLEDRTVVKHNENEIRYIRSLL